MEQPTPWPPLVAGLEAMPKVCGVGVAMLPGYSWAPAGLIEHRVNVGTIRDRPDLRHPALRDGAGSLPAEGRGWGGGLVVVRARERRAHGEGDQ
jgi:hypothetical protein